MIGADHFRLLRNFGRSTVRSQLDGKQQATLWELSCRQANLPHIPLDEVKKAWASYVQGSSRLAGLAVNGDADPKYISIGVTFQGRVTAAHTLPTRALLRKVMEVHARTFSSQDEFLQDLLELAGES